MELRQIKPSQWYKWNITQFTNNCIGDNFIPNGSNSGNVDEESPIGTLVGNLVANDPDSPNLTYSLVGGNGTNDTITIIFCLR